MGLFDAPAQTPVELEASSTTTAPQYLTDYLTNLASAGTGALGTVTTGADGTTTLTPFTGDELIADLPENLTNLYKDASTTLERYEDPMDKALTALQSGAEGISAADISAFYDPYQQDVVNEMARQSALNVQRGLLPALRGAFAGQGAFGSQRYAGATGQALGDVQADLLGQQAKLRSAGFQSALDAALKSRGYDIQAGQALGTLGSQEAAAGAQAVKTLGDIGTQELGYEQSKIEAPLTRAQNVAQIMRGYTYPTSTQETREALPSAYGLSPLQQIGTLGSLIGSAFGQTYDPKTGKVIDTGIGWKPFETLKDWIDKFSPSETLDPNVYEAGSQEWD